MIEGKYLKHGKITEVYLGNGITELFPADQLVEVEPVEKTIEAFTFMPKKVKEDHSGHNMVVLTSVAVPLILTAILADFVPDAVFTVMFWAAIGWAALVGVANLRR